MVYVQRLLLFKFSMHYIYLSLSGLAAVGNLEKCISSPDGVSMEQYSIGFVKRRDAMLNAFPLVVVCRVLSTSWLSSQVPKSLHYSAIQTNVPRVKY